METLDYWRLCDEVSVDDAACLIVGADPAKLHEEIPFLDSGAVFSDPAGFKAARTALINAVLGKRLEATLRYPARCLSDDEYPKIGEQVYDKNLGYDIAFTDVPDWKQSTIKVEDLRAWLISRGFKTGFFFPDHVDAPDYLDKSHPCYAPKLAAAVDAWQALASNESLLDGKTPKQAIEKWLRENASRFGLSDDDGNPNKDGIEQISKVANWRPEGGAAKTKGNPPTPKKANKNAAF